MKIKLGEDRILPLRTMIKSKCSEEPLKIYPLSSVTEITVKLPKQDGTLLLKKFTDTSVTITSAADGQFAVSLTDAETLTLKVGNDQSFDVEVEKGTEKRIFEFLNLLSVKK